MVSFARADGIVVEAMGHLWAAFSPLSGETVLLNDECAAILEVLQDGPASSAAVADALAADAGADSESIRSLVEEAWQQLIVAGLVEEVPPARHPIR